MKTKFLFKPIVMTILMGVSTLFVYGQNQDVEVGSNLLILGKMGVDYYPANKLDVNGTVRTKEVRVNTWDWPDFVFDKEYKLLSLAEVEAYIETQGHLPGIPSTADATTNGVDLMEINAKLLQKVEELTLYVIEQNKELNKQEDELLFLNKEIDRIQQQQN